ncbi:hypothetical protein C2U71_12440 [Burkholderia ubonensis]|nr:hypothetical protein C2U71_12440 [Burkholderia ubonensis]
MALKSAGSRLLSRSFAKSTPRTHPSELATSHIPTMSWIIGPEKMLSTGNLLILALVISFFTIRIMVAILRQR